MRSTIESLKAAFTVMVCGTLFNQDLEMSVFYCTNTGMKYKVTEVAAEGGTL